MSDAINICESIVEECEARREIEELLRQARIEALIEITLREIDAEIEVVV